MNQRGDVSLLMVTSMLALTGIMILCSLELAHSYNQLKKRTQLFLCVKETKAELHQYLKPMGHSNWAIKNLKRAKLVMIFIPGLQGASASSEKLLQFLIQYQNLQLGLYLNKLRGILSRGCKLEPRLFMTPFELSLAGYVRNNDGSAKKRSDEWTYYFINLPYALSLKINLQELESIRPKINYQAQEIEAKSFFLSSFAY